MVSPSARAKPLEDSPLHRGLGQNYYVLFAGSHSRPYKLKFTASYAIIPTKCEVFSMIKILFVCHGSIKTQINFS